MRAAAWLWMIVVSALISPQHTLRLGLLLFLRPAREHNSVGDGRKKRRAKTEEGPLQRQWNTLFAHEAARFGGGMALQFIKQRGRCGCMLWWWWVNGCDAGGV
eukprot:scaffold139642_cov36-Cyclotella_meneghiniana.AAC.4